MFRRWQEDDDGEKERCDFVSEMTKYSGPPRSNPLHVDVVLWQLDYYYDTSLFSFIFFRCIGALYLPFALEEKAIPSSLQLYSRVVPLPNWRKQKAEL